MNRFCAKTLALILVAAVQTPCPGQPSATAASIQDAWFTAGLGRYPDAIAQYQRIVENSGDELVPVPPPLAELTMLGGGTACTIPWQSRRALPARWIVHDQIGRWPPAALNLYRDRADVVAARRFQEARDATDDRLLEQVLADWFNSRIAESVILSLAQRAFERADFATAEWYWRMLLPGGERCFPAPKIEPAAVMARLILAQLTKGNLQAAKRDLQALRATNRDASGLLAGRNGRYVDTLEGLLNDSGRLQLRPLPGDGKEWTTFAGNSSRDSLISNKLPRFWPGPPQWRAELPADPEVKFRLDERQMAVDHPAALAFHPIIVHGRAFVADANHVFSFDLLTGERTVLFDQRRTLAIPNIDGRLPVRDGQRFTLTFANSFLYVRISGTQSRRVGRNDPAENPADGASAIVCLGPISEQKSVPIKNVWTLRPPKSDKDVFTTFEGSPLVRDGKLFVVLRQQGGTGALFVACYQTHGSESAPELLWQQEVAKSSPNPGDPITRQCLLTLAGPNLVLCTNSGNIVALDPVSGKPAWDFSYVSGERRPNPIGREMCPCLSDGARVFAAPADSDLLLCLDARSGRPLWDQENVDVVHLLGVTRGRLIATFAGAMKGIRGIDVVSGSQSSPLGWIQHDDGGVTTFGRGFVTPDLIFWPTRHGMQFLRPEDGSPARQPAPGLFGNLAYAEGCFVVTNARQVMGFVCEGKLIDQPAPSLPKQPSDTFAIYKRGRMHADAGQVEQALEDFGKVASTGLDAPMAERARSLAAILREEKAPREQPNDRSNRGPPPLKGFAAHVTQLLYREGNEPSLRQVERQEDARPHIRSGSPGGAVPQSISIKGDSPFRIGWQREQPQSRFLALLPLRQSVADRDDNVVWLAGPDGLRRIDPARATPELTLSTSMTIEGMLTAPGRDLFYGSHGLFCHRADKVEPDWSIRLADVATVFPEDEPSLLIDPPGLLNGKLTAFHRSSRALYALLDDRLLLAIDIETGSLLWSHWAVSSRSLWGDDAVSIRPFFHAGERYLLLQLSSGRVRIVDAVNGQTHQEFSVSRSPWIGDPVKLGEHRVAYAEDPETIVCLDLQSGRLLWRSAIPHPSSLVGNSPEMKLLGGLLVIGMERNIGTEFFALNPRTGQRVWTEPVFVGPQPVPLGAIDGDATQLYVATCKGVVSIAMALGGRPEVVTLAEGIAPASRVLLWNEYLVVYPTFPVPDREVELGREFEKLASYLPTYPRVGRIVGRLYHVWRERTLPLLVFSRRDGRLQQRFDFPAAGLLADVRPVPQGLTVVTGAGIWKLEESPAR